jgi:glutamate dehydrogenase/leucine dehydrogenase
VAVGDANGAVFRKEGFKVADLKQYVNKKGTVSGFPGADPISNEELLELQCDVLIPAALECVINSRNAERIQAKVIVEGANLPTTTAADEILERRGVLVVPDILANAGGVTCSYFEWAQNLQQVFWDEDHVNKELEKIMVRAYRAVADRAKKEKLSLRTAAYAVAIERVARAEKLRGT